MAIRPISAVFDDLLSGLREERVTAATLLEAFHERGFGAMILLFSLPLALPVPKPPGISSILSVPLLLLTAQQALGFHTVWFPDFVKRKSVATTSLASVFHHARPWMRRLEYITRPRLGFITQGIFSRMIGILGFIMAVSVAVPLPGSNTIPGMGIAIMALGVVMRDGLAVIAGALIGTIYVIVYTGILVFFGRQGVDAALTMMGAWL